MLKHRKIQRARRRDELKKPELRRQVLNAYWAAVQPALEQQNSGVGSDTKYDNEPFRNQNTYTVLEATDTNRRHANLEAGVVENQVIIFCMEWDLGGNRERDSIKTWLTRCWLNF